MSDNEYINGELSCKVDIKGRGATGGVAEFDINYEVHAIYPQINELEEDVVTDIVIHDGVKQIKGTLDENGILYEYETDESGNILYNTEGVTFYIKDEEGEQITYINHEDGIEIMFDATYEISHNQDANKLQLTNKDINVSAKQKIYNVYKTCNFDEILEVQDDLKVKIVEAGGFTVSGGGSKNNIVLDIYPESIKIIDENEKEIELKPNKEILTVEATITSDGHVLLNDIIDLSFNSEYQTDNVSQNKFVYNVNGGFIINGYYDDVVIDAVNIYTDEYVEDVKLVIYKEEQPQHIDSIDFDKIGHSMSWSENCGINTKNSGLYKITQICNNNIYNEHILLGEVDTSSIVDGAAKRGGGRDNGMFSYTAIKTFDSSLSRLTNGSKMFNGCDELSTFQPRSLDVLVTGSSMFLNCSSLSGWTTELPNILFSDRMFENTKLVTFDTDISSLTCSNLYDEINKKCFSNAMFKGCDALETFKSDLQKLMVGNDMFYGCSAMTTFACESLEELIGAKDMFKNCSSLTTFNTKLKNIVDSSGMFDGCVKLVYFTPNLGDDDVIEEEPFTSLKTGSNMFKGCIKLTSFEYPLPSLTDGVGMFDGCASLTNFKQSEIGLRQLQDGRNMFRDCKLGAEAVNVILNNIPDNRGQSEKILTISVSEEGAIEFENITTEKPTNNIVEVTYKGWTIQVNKSQSSSNS